MTDEPFALALNCVDGRVQRPLLRWIDDELSLVNVDLLTVPGPDGTILEGGEEVDRVRQLASFLSRERRHRCLVLAGHHDCLGNPVGDAEHRRQVEEAVHLLHGWSLTPRTIGVWMGEGWDVEVVADLEQA